MESCPCYWGRGPRRGNLGPEKQRGLSKVTRGFMAKPGLRPGSVATQGWKLKAWVRDLVPLGLDLSHSSVIIDPSLLLLLERPAGYAPSRILEQMVHVFHFMRINLYYSIFLSFSLQHFILSLDFLNQRISLENIKISLNLLNGILRRCKIYNLNASQVLLMNGPHLENTLRWLTPPTKLSTKF